MVVIDVEPIRERFSAVAPFLDERGRRLVAAAEALVKSGLRPEHDLVFAAVAQEETGMKGMKALYAQWKDRAVGFVDILGDGHSITYGAISIHWWKVVAGGPPGHSLNGGVPNVNQGIGRAVDRILQLPQPAQHPDRRVVINVAMPYATAMRCAGGGDGMAAASPTDVGRAAPPEAVRRSIDASSAYGHFGGIAPSPSTAIGCVARAATIE